MVRLFLLLSILLLTACDNNSAPPPQQQPTFGDKPSESIVEYSFGVHPLHNPKQLLDIYGPLVDYLNQHLTGIVLKLEASRNYAVFEEKLYSRQFAFALPNPYQTIESESKGYRIFGKMSDDENFRGIILVRKDSGIQVVADLKGKKISYPAPTAVAAAMLPQYYLHTHGLDVNKDVENVYAGSQESSIMNVYLKTTVAGATWPIPWKNFQKDQPDKVKELEVKWETTNLPNNALVVRDDIAPEIVSKVAELLFTLHTQPAGQAILARIPVSKLEVAQHETYEPTRTFLKTFATTVRPIVP
ncbi:MAG: phosphonate ABC transporter substrate-binding protein [Beggiatoa sp. IS2]|nr:MAG: phosphonate ABC transporter substrate-binding protein [Beggiatoa sp. IS2]